MNAQEIERELRERGYPTDTKPLAKLIERYVLQERERCAKLLEDEAKATALGAIDQQKGASVYNWLMWACRFIRAN